MFRLGLYFRGNVILCSQDLPLSGLWEMVPESSSEECTLMTGVCLSCVSEETEQITLLFQQRLCAPLQEIYCSPSTSYARHRNPVKFQRWDYPYESFSHYMAAILITRHLPFPKWSPSLPAENKLNSNHKIQRKGRKNGSGRADNTQMISKTASDAAFVMH